jgi:hypothetical protein
MKKTKETKKSVAPAKEAAGNETQRGKTSRATTVVEARIDAGEGNAVFIRGGGGGLSWDQGQPLSCVDSGRWLWSSAGVDSGVPFKLLLNDERWMAGPDMVIQPGERLEIAPTF